MLKNVSTTLVTSSQGTIEGIVVSSSTFRAGAFMAMEAVQVGTRTTSRGTSNGVHFADTLVDSASSAVVFGATNQIVPRAGVHYYRSTTYGTSRGVLVSGASAGFGRPAAIVFTTPPDGLAPTVISPGASLARNAHGVVMASTSDPVSDAMAAYLLERGRALGFSADLDVALSRLGSASHPFAVEDVSFAQGAVKFALPFAGNAPHPSACTPENGVHLVVRNATIRFGLHITGAGCIQNITIVNSTIGGFTLTHFAIAGGHSALTLTDSTFIGEVSLSHGAIASVSSSAIPSTNVPAVVVVNATIVVAEGPFDSCLELANVTFASGHGRMLVDGLHAESPLSANFAALRFDDMKLAGGATVTVTRSVIRMLPPTFLYSHCLTVSGANTHVDASSLFTVSHTSMFARGKKDPWKYGRVYGVTLSAPNWWTLLANRSVDAASASAAGVPPRFAVGIALYGNTYDIVGLVPNVAAALTVSSRTPMSVLERLFVDVLLRTHDTSRPVARGFIVASTDDAPDWTGLSDARLDGGIHLSFDKLDMTFVSDAFARTKEFSFARLELTKRFSSSALASAAAFLSDTARSLAACTWSTPRLSVAMHCCQSRRRLLSVP
jgi:hypothetical protein